MPRRPSAGPTELELAILNVLWEHGPSSVRAVHAALGRDRTTGYSSTLKMIQVMTAKGMVRRDDSARPHVYQPARSQPDTQRRLVRDLADSAFNGAIDRLVMTALRSGSVSRQEIDRIKQMLDEHTEKQS